VLAHDRRKVLHFGIIEHPTSQWVGQQVIEAFAGRKALAEVAAAAKPDTLLRWCRARSLKKFDGSTFRKVVGRPPVEEEIERLIVRMARENPSWGYDRIVGAMTNLGGKLSNQTVGNILRRNDIPPGPAAEEEYKLEI
jgi:hypothetical protein